jgi:D-alanyl-D-alanine carboxypeptidase
MKRFFFINLILAITLISCEKDDIFSEEFYRGETELPENNPNHPKAKEFKNLMDEIVAAGIPGIQLTVHDSLNGYWSGAAGLADLVSNVALESNHITRVGSTVKTFTAVTILLLQEEGKLNLDDPVTAYLSAKDTKGLKNAEKSTIRQLLQHSSGIYNYILNLQFQTASLNDLIKTWYPEELLDYARGQEAYFEPGEDMQYSNTNYILLGMIIEKVTGKPFYEVFREKIFEPQNLQFTQFAATDPVPNGIVRGYVDFYSNMNLINATYYSGWDYFSADGGLLSNAYDLNVFMTRLFSGQVLTEPSIAELLSWQAPKEQFDDEFETFYGLGIFKLTTEFGPAWMHSGDAIGYFASMLYFPEQKTTITWAVNGNYGKLNNITQTKTAMEKIFRAVLD